MHIERRTHRSANTTEALTLQLAATAHRAACRAIVLSDGSGLTLAASGDDAACEEVAILAPTLARDGRPWHGALHTAAGERIITITPVSSDLGTLLLCAVGGQLNVLRPELASGSAGVARILS